MRNGTNRSAIRAGLRVKIVLKKDQPSGALTEGVVKEILTGSSTHPHGIKVRLEDGQVGREYLLKVRISIQVPELPRSPMERALYCNTTPLPHT